jgi:predicted lipase
MPRLFQYDASRTSLYTPCQYPFFNGWKPKTDEALCSELSRLAYCEKDSISKTLTVAGLSLVGEPIRESDGRGTFGFVARNQDKAILAFRGTQSDDPTDLADDADFFHESWTMADTQVVNVHCGFARALSRVWNQVEDRLKDLKLPLLATGHSLGAALACLAASRLSTQKLITFGGPRVGDAQFCKLMSKRTQTLRYQNCCDVVCQMPPAAGKALPGYDHFGSLQYIDRNGDFIPNVRESDARSDQLEAHVDYIAEYSWRISMVSWRGMADHAPINYVSVLAAQ